LVQRRFSPFYKRFYPVQSGWKFYLSPFLPSKRLWTVSMEINTIVRRKKFARRRPAGCLARRKKC
jgi:hypothetical protein